MPVRTASAGNVSISIAARSSVVRLYSTTDGQTWVERSEPTNACKVHSIGCSRIRRDEPRDTLPTAEPASRPCTATRHAHTPNQAGALRDAPLRENRETGGSQGLHPTDRLTKASLSLQHRHAENPPISLLALTKGSAPHGGLKIHLHEAVGLPVSSAFTARQVIAKQSTERGQSLQWALSRSK